MSSDNNIKQFVAGITGKINDDLKDFAPLQSASKKFGQEPSHIVLATVGIVIILTLTGIFQHIFITLFGLLYPAYMSYKVFSL